MIRSRKSRQCCARHTSPLEQKLDALLALTDIGHDRPREFGMELQCLASDATLDDVLKRVFVLCLPLHIVTAITGSLRGKLETVIVAANKAWTAAAVPSSAVSVSAVSGPPSRGVDAANVNVGPTSRPR